MKKRLNLGKLFTIILLLPVFEPKLFTQYTFSTLLYGVMNLGVFSYYLFLFMKNGKRLWVI